ncbi:MAG: hypothetical protein HY216_03925 [Candidatus Rokubacteria bacterium]|nr:hypothetical protein [Candidatus Rokubacteria bacterium]
MKKESADLTRAVDEAEGAVASVKDPELRRAAFEKILDHLLAGSGPTAKKDKAKSGGSRAKAKSGPQGRLEELVHEGFFKKPRTLSEVKSGQAGRGSYSHREKERQVAQRLQFLRGKTCPAAD